MEYCGWEDRFIACWAYPRLLRLRLWLEMNFRCANQTCVTVEKSEEIMGSGNFRKLLFAGVVGLVTAFGSQQISAQEFSLDQMVNALLPETGGNRGLQRKETIAATTALQGSGRPTARLIVSFDGDTHLLTVEGMKTLRTLATALQDPRLENAQYQIMAFAYTPNAPAAALPVSTRRAQAVMEHLSGFYGLAGNKFLGIQGMGATALHSTNAADPMNQRIEIVNVGSF